MDNETRKMALAITKTLIAECDRIKTVSDGLKTLAEILSPGISEELSEGHYEDVHQDSYTANKR